MNQIALVDKLIDGCLENDPLSQKRLYERYADAMYTLAYRIINNEQEAMDVLQDTFVIVFTKLDSFRKESTIGAWIKKILIREALRKLKSIKRVVQLEEITADEHVEWPDDVSGQELHQAIQELPDGYRTVFTLIEVEGYAHKEVAELLNISVGTSKSQLFRAKQILQKKLRYLRD